MKRFCLLLISIFSVFTASAVPLSNFYVDGFGGLNFVNSWKGEDIAIASDIGYAVGGGVGYRFTPSFSLEIEGAYRFNGLQLSIESSSFSGENRLFTLLVNGLVEIPLFGNTIVPHLGIGIGRGWEIEKYNYDTRSELDYRIIVSSIYTYGYVMQGIIGLTWNLAPKMQLAPEYRFLGANHTFDLRLRRCF